MKKTSIKQIYFLTDYHKSAPKLFVLGQLFLKIKRFLQYSFYSVLALLLLEDESLRLRKWTHIRLCLN